MAIPCGSTCRRPWPTVLATLRDGGHEAALVGGCVRDLVRGEQPADWDVATSAPPETVAGTLSRSHLGEPVRHGDRPRSGRRPGDRGHDLPGRGGLPRPAAARRGALGRRRWPRTWRGATSPINAMAWLPDQAAGGSGRLVDPFGGAADLEAGVLRAVGDPDARFSEDALRLLRAVRLATRSRPAARSADRGGDPRATRRRRPASPGSGSATS